MTITDACSPAFPTQEICGPPQIPCRRGAVRCPPEAVTGELLRLRQLSLAVCELEALPDPQVVDGQNVGPAQIEDQQHLGYPAANTLDADEPLHDFSVGHAVA